MTWETALLCFAAGLICAHLGAKGEARQWRANAHQVMRKESGGRLYKVTLDED